MNAALRLISGEGDSENLWKRLSGFNNALTLASSVDNSPGSPDSKGFVFACAADDIALLPRIPSAGRTPVGAMLRRLEPCRVAEENVRRPRELCVGCDECLSARMHFWQVKEGETRISAGNWVVS